jgi:hypothetical protein
MSTKSSINALQKANDSLKGIKETLIPYLQLLDRYHRQQQNAISNENEGNGSKIDRYQITEAETAISLSIGTLRYMALRLKGMKSSNGSTKNDPLRMELDKIRKTLVELKKLKKKIKPTTKNKSKSPGSSVETSQGKKEASKKRKSDEGVEDQIKKVRSKRQK